MKRFLSFLLPCLLCVPWFSSFAAADGGKPNFLIFLADDLGWNDVGFHGSKIKTPNLDRLAAEGLMLEQHYVAPLCSPTRTGLMTGRFWSRFGVTNPQNEQALPFGTETIASALKSVGYQTALFGKWHLGSLPEQGPNKFGFDRSYGSLAGGVGPYDHHYKKGPFTQTWHRDCKLVEEEGHVTDLIAREAVNWVKTLNDRPFLLYVPFTAVHIPIDEPKEWLDKNPQFDDPDMRRYAACATHMDAAVGRILDALRAAGRLDQTLVLFFSDNGGSIGVRNDDLKYPGTYPPGRTTASNTPLRGQKGQLYEGGIRTPAIAWWPKRLKPGKVNVPLHITDWMPTLTRLAGYQPKRNLKWDGQDVWPVLSGDAEQLEARVLYWLGPGRKASAIRLGDWKLIVTGDKQELFNIATDPEEKENVAGTQPEQLTELTKLLARHAARDNDAVVPRTKGAKQAADIQE
jgi:arylsulfatase A-like enzyme